MTRSPTSARLVPASLLPNAPILVAAGSPGILSLLPVLPTGAGMGRAVLRTLSPNGLPGLAFELLLFARRDLLAAIIAHAAVHTGFAIVAVAVTA